MKIPRPFMPVRLRREGLDHIVSVVGREMRFGPNSLPASITASGEELLAAPVRLVGMEDGEPIVWETDYDVNESKSFIHRETDEAVTICGSLRSFRFVADTAVTIEYDGCISIDLKLMTRGRTVPEMFGLASWQERRYMLDNLWLEIPLRRDLASFYSFFPNSPILSLDGTQIPQTATTHSGRIPEPGMALPFKGLFWYGSAAR
ncbi:MAG: hypothetical protein E7463_12800, partial [Ruminococcaceae bacterium]|nr:hypothetical protein [Oscillospiraceae bacterium]